MTLCFLNHGINLLKHKPTYVSLALFVKERYTLKVHFKLNQCVKQESTASCDNCKHLNMHVLPDKRVYPYFCYYIWSLSFISGHQQLVQTNVTPCMLPYYKLKCVSSASLTPLDDQSPNSGVISRLRLLSMTRLLLLSASSQLWVWERLAVCGR